MVFFVRMGHFCHVGYVHIPICGFVKNWVHYKLVRNDDNYIQKY